MATVYNGMVVLGMPPREHAFTTLLKSWFLEPNLTHATFQVQDLEHAIAQETHQRRRLVHFSGTPAQWNYFPEENYWKRNSSGEPFTFYKLITSHDFSPAPRMLPASPGTLHGVSAVRPGHHEDLHIGDVVRLNVYEGGNVLRLNRELGNYHRMTEGSMPLVNGNL